MALSKSLSLIFLQLLCVLCVLNLSNGKGLDVNFYEKTCPFLEFIVKDVTAKFISRTPSLAPPLLRMHFHDCFVRGCDGSVLLNSTSKNQAEKAAIPNQFLIGYQVIDAVKSAVEKICPGVVSCADIVALVARDAITLIKGPSWQVELGRRDGTVSIASEALNKLPSPFMNITQLKASFQSVGLSVKDLAVLSGGHTIGISHCIGVNPRLFNFTGKGDTDPSLDPKYLAKLRRQCKPGDVTTILPMDSSPKKFDIDYYTTVSNRRGLFQSDAALLDDTETKTYIQQHLSHAGSMRFFDDFGVSMVNMGRIGVLTGKNGEIRKQCAFVN
ncbi:peroxidase 27-like [Coffea arabica]|uniref:Peroxidase n=1 Tax=Coffea arabica TaxID=13443 RepID=A0A6P6XMR3_COFAR|nr:peroxidase 27-like [Coffea arabica]